MFSKIIDDKLLRKRTLYFDSDTFRHHKTLNRFGQITKIFINCNNYNSRWVIDDQKQRCDPDSLSSKAHPLLSWYTDDFDHQRVLQIGVDEKSPTLKTINRTPT